MSEEREIRMKLKDHIEGNFRKFRRAIVPDGYGNYEMRWGGRYGLAIDPMSPSQSIKNPRIGRYVLIRKEGGGKHDDQKLCMHMFVQHVMAGFYALSVVNATAARIAWYRYAEGLSYADCSREVLGREHPMDAYRYFNDEKFDLITWWGERFKNIALPIAA